MRQLLAPLLLVVVVLLVPLLPLAALGLSFEDRVQAWFRDELTAAQLAALVVAVLTVDLVLPVPSSMVSTFAGAQLGFWPALLASWTGMTLGAAIGFAAARYGGRPLAVRFAGTAWLDRLDRLNTRYGSRLVVLTRALPIVAEASVLLVGVTGLGWLPFLVSCGLSNLGIAIVYSAFGRFAYEQHSVPAALVASIAIPLLATLLFKRMLDRRIDSDRTPDQAATS